MIDKLLDEFSVDNHRLKLNINNLFLSEYLNVQFQSNGCRKSW